MGVEERRRKYLHNPTFNSPHPNSIAAEIRARGNKAQKVALKNWEKQIRQDYIAMERWYRELTWERR